MKPVTVYREWPGDYEIAGVGVPEPWARKSARNKGVNDGEMAGGQEKFGFSLLRYKFEIARLEGWSDWRDWTERGEPGFEESGWRIPNEEELRRWDEAHGSAEAVRARIVDGRAAAQSKLGMSADLTLLDMLNLAGMRWQPASGAKIASGEERINAALDWARAADGKTRTLAPSLRFSRHAVNHVWAMENYLGADGQKGACKEPVDCLRYLYQSGYTEGDFEGNVLVLDPAPERNWFMGWYRIGAGAGQAAPAAEPPAAPSRAAMRGGRRVRW